MHGVIASVKKEDENMNEIPKQPQGSSIPQQPQAQKVEQPKVDVVPEAAP